jgi:hypothetical protein
VLFIPEAICCRARAGRNLPAGIEGAVVDLVTDFWLARGRDPSVKRESEPGVFER